MPPTVSAFLASASEGMPTASALSGIFGSISLTAWICLLLPQLVANHKSKSADGLSMAFLVVWLLGDATNFVGALLTRLAPTAIALAGYFCVADVVLISQCLYYNNVNAKKAQRSPRDESARPTEDSPLLRANESGAGAGSSQRRHSTHAETAAGLPRKVVTGKSEVPDSNSWLNNALSLFAVYLIGFAGWFVSYQLGAWGSAPPSEPDSPSDSKTTAEVVGLALGYTSAVLYLFARVPQIIKNWRQKSCDGLALLFFMLSLTGNLTYGISLMLYSQEKKYLLNALPWLLGSLGTIVEDSIIFVQFRLYSGSTGIRPTLIE